MIRHAGMFFPEDGTLTKNLAIRLSEEKIYHGDRFEEAMSLVPRFGTALDAGANVGMWTVPLAERFEKVVAVEPNPENFVCLSANLARFRNVDFRHAALGDRRRSVAMRNEKNSAISARVVDAPGDYEMIRIDDLGLTALDYAKIHVNGFELETIAGAEETLRRFRPLLTVVLKAALSNFGHSVEDVVEKLASVGYRAVGGKKPYRIFAP